jgi:N-succinyl-L-ornithine transcarbamylase
MKQFSSVKDVLQLAELVRQAIELKKNPFAHQELGKNRLLGLVFLNPSLRTRMSTQKAAMNLGMNVISLNAGQDGWKLEMQDGAIMNTDTVEHIKDAAAVMGAYCDIIGLRSFPQLKDRDEDYSEKVLKDFVRYSAVPVLSLESATLHPLQSLADMITIEEHKKRERPKVVLTWAPHIRALPQAVGNSFAEWAIRMGYEVVITQPHGYELAPEFTQGAKIEYNQKHALDGAEFVYAKNWSAYDKYGQMPKVDSNWIIDKEKMRMTQEGRFMHCLPVRRNVEVSDEVIDGPLSLTIQQAANRVPAAQVILKRMLEALPRIGK